VPYTCPTCGFPELTDPPYRKNGKPDYSNEGEPSYDICDCCNYQFGRTDLDEEITFEEYRKEWIREGMKWDKGRTEPPKDWDPTKQLLNIGIKI
jgi:hypothetical protein